MKGVIRKRLAAGCSRQAVGVALPVHSVLLHVFLRDGIQTLGWTRGQHARKVNASSSSSPGLPSPFMGCTAPDGLSICVPALNPTATLRQVSTPNPQPEANPKWGSAGGKQGL